MMNKLLALILVAYSCASLAQPSEPEYFLDHYFIKPGETKTVAYSIPTSQHYLQCNQDGFGADLGAIEWKYNGTSFKGQIGNYHQLTLVRVDMNHTTIAAFGDVADTSGDLIITNLDTTDLYISCRYSLTKD